MKQYHVLVVGFELSKQNKDASSRTTDLRHYRYDITDHSITNENGAWVVKQGKEMKAAFPVNKTMVLIEDVEAKV